MNLNGRIDYAPRPGRGSMAFTYEVVPLWQRPAEELLAADLGVVPLAMLGRLPEALPLEEGLAAVAQRVAERVRHAIEFTERPDRFLYGTDWPLAPMSVYPDFVRELFDEKHHQAVFEDNAKSLFKLGGVA